MQFYNENQAIRVCLQDPSLIFQLIKEGYTEVVYKIISKNKELINVVDDNGNNVMMKLLSKKQYDLVYRLMKNKEWDINHQNIEGNTFSHILASLDYLKIAKILDLLMKNKTFLPNIKNNKDETIFDISLLSNQLSTATKILQNKKFNNIDIVSVKYMYDKYINNSYYGKYTKINNLEIIINNLEKKDYLKPRVKTLLDLLNNNMDIIKDGLLNNNSNNIYELIESLV